MRFCGLDYQASIAGIVYLQLLFWGSSITTIISIYLASTGKGDDVLLPCYLLLLLASATSIAYIYFHQLHARRRQALAESFVQRSSIKRPVYIAVRFAIAVAAIWVISTGWNLITAARQPVCLPYGPSLALWQFGQACRAQRAAAAFSLINLLSACALFAHMATTRDPFESHLMGKIKDRPETITPYRYPSGPLSNPKPVLQHADSSSSEDSLKEKPRSHGPNPEHRPLTPIATDLPGPIGLGLFMSPDFPVMPPLMQSPQFYHSNRASISSRAPSVSSVSRAEVLKGSPTNQLPGFTPPTKYRHVSPSPLATDSAWRAMHPPASQFRHVSAQSPSLRLSSSPRLATIRNVPTSPSLPGLSCPGHSPRRSQSIRSGGSRGHSRSRSTPHAAPEPESSPAKPSSRSSSGSDRRRGHVRCTSDPNEMISAHMAAELHLSKRLDRKLQEVSMIIKAQGSGGSNTATDTTASSGRSESESGNSNTNTESSRTELSADTAGSAGLAKVAAAEPGSEALVFPVRESSRFARMEWDVLMGRERVAGITANFGGRHSTIFN